MEERHVLVIFPHPDDEAFGVSGTIAHHIEQGTPVTYACLTLGEMGRNMGNPPFATRETLPLIREQELEEACKAVGITDLRKLGYHDKTIEFEQEATLASEFRTMIEEVNPSLVITFYPGYSVHPDHEATGRAVVRAIKDLPQIDRPKLHCVAFANNSWQELGEPDITFDARPVIDKKIACIQSHRTQLEGFMKGLPHKLAAREQGVMDWINTERFWTYKWDEN